jgi:hypothetical protein
MKPGDAIYALCRRPDAAEKSVNELVSLSIATDDIIVISSEPLEHYRVRGQDRVAMPWLAVCGAIVGGIGGFLLSTLTQATYPIATGGMPIVTLWTDGIITYELTMLGAILTTIVVFLSTRPLAGWHELPDEPQVSQGNVLVGVSSVPEGLRDQVIRLLNTYGEVKQYRG